MYINVILFVLDTSVI